MSIHVMKLRRLVLCASTLTFVVCGILNSIAQGQLADPGEYVERDSDLDQGRNAKADGAGQHPTVPPSEVHSAAALIKLLSHDEFAYRQGASYDLRKRGFANLDLLLEALSADCAERRVRASNILAMYCQEARKSQLHSPRVTATSPSASHFWEGNNPSLGGLFDRSLDCAVKIKFDAESEVTQIISPLYVRKAVTSRQESLGTVSWNRSMISPPDALLFLTRPKLPFNRVDVDLLIPYVTQIRDTMRIELQPGETVLRTGYTTVVVEPLSLKEQESRAQRKLPTKRYRVTLCDLLGRLETEDSRLRWNIGQERSPEPEASLNPYKQSWLIGSEAQAIVGKDGSAKTESESLSLAMPFSLDIELDTGQIIDFARASIVVPYPEP